MELKPINTIYAGLAVDKEGNEGLIAVDNFPLVVSQKSLLPGIIEILKSMEPQLLKDQKMWVIGKFGRKGDHVRPE